MVQRPLEGKTAVLWVGGGGSAKEAKDASFGRIEGLGGQTAVLWVGGGVLERKQRTPVLAYRGPWRAKQLSFGGGGRGGGSGKEARDASFGGTEGLGGEPSFLPLPPSLLQPVI